MLGICTLVGIAFASAAVPVGFGLAAFCDLASELGDGELRVLVGDLRVEARHLRPLGRHDGEPAGERDERDEAGGGEGEDSGCDGSLLWHLREHVRAQRELVGLPRSDLRPRARLQRHVREGGHELEPLHHAGDDVLGERDARDGERGRGGRGRRRRARPSPAPPCSTCMLRLESHDPAGSTRETSSSRLSHLIRAPAAVVNAATRAWSPLCWRPPSGAWRDLERVDLLLRAAASVSRRSDARSWLCTNETPHEESDCGDECRAAGEHRLRGQQRRARCRAGSAPEGD